MTNAIKNTAWPSVLILVFVLSCTSENNKLPDKILVESRTTKYKFIQDKIDATGTLYEKIFFDKLGRDSIIENYKSDGKLYLRTILHYDSLGNKIKSEDYKPDGKVEATTVFIYSDDNLLLERNRKHVNGE
ncbi:MAG: hypothetical protein P8X47_03555 [Ignavibacteriaceae bacterium]